MAIRIRWDKYETALLIETFWKIEQNPQEKKSLIRELSQLLRSKAINNGIEIDDVFRNENGIAMQLVPIAHAFFPERPTLTTSVLFEDMVKMYINNKSEFDKILADAKDMTVIKNESISQENNEQLFIKWLKENDEAEEKISEVVFAINEVSEYAKNNRIIKGSLFDIITTDEFSAIFRKIIVLKKFRVEKKKLANSFVAAAGMYKRYLDTLRNKEKSELIDEVDEKAKEEIGLPEDVLKIINSHYCYGININSPIEIMRFHRYYLEEHGKECEVTDGELISLLKENGCEINGKIFLVSPFVKKRLNEIIDVCQKEGALIVYFNEIYLANETWLNEEYVLSEDMVKSILRKVYPEFVFKTHYMLLSKIKHTEIEALKIEITNVWGEEILQSFDELNVKMPYVPLEKIKYALSYGEKFFWNSFEIYANIDCFVISESKIMEIREYVGKMCDEKGSVHIGELPIEDVLTDNYELSETSFNGILFSYLSDDFAKNEKILVRKEDKKDLFDTIVQYCRVKEECSFAELEQFVQTVAGEVKYPVLIEAANSSMIRLDLDKFTADKNVDFLVEDIDGVLEDIVREDAVGIKEVATFSMFPYCGYDWNLFLLESFCRRFSKKFKYLCITPNSKNAGAIVKKDSILDYHSIMVNAVARREEVALNEKEIFDYLLESGYMIRRKYSGMQDLIEKVSVLRERR